MGLDTRDISAITTARKDTGRGGVWSTAAGGQAQNSRFFISLKSFWESSLLPSSSGRRVATRVGSTKRAWRGLDCATLPVVFRIRSEEHTSELQSRENLVCRLLLE